ncbi:TIR domain-containing protein [Reticulibacter mediterranei]|nr:TIR domain-containing protein [Reticulibacter mediterranei]
MTPLTIFSSYAHTDEALRDELGKHLSFMQRQGLISVWHDRQILPGDEWAYEIDAHLETAAIILLLISSDFLSSHYCYDIEMRRALERHKRGEARVIPIILRPCDWQAAPFGHLQCLPPNGRAVTSWQNQDEAFLMIAQGLRRVLRPQQPTFPLSRLEQQNRTRLLKRVHTIWIDGVLQHSLHQTALIALDLQEQPDALANPWRLEVQETNLPPCPLPSGTPLVQVYDEAEGQLLILGEPGAGKTTLLLDLAADLLTRAEQDRSLPIPVIFPLSSWAEKRFPLATWLVEELFTKYQVPRALGHAWVEQELLLPLLDGLDEVAEPHQSACIQAINTYRHEHSLVPIVLCSRTAEYRAQAVRVTLSKAVVIQPLTTEQIDSYLTQAGQQLAAVHSLLRTDQELQELARTPLMLTILALTYHGKAVDDLAMSLPPEALRQHVLATYVERMLQRRAVSRYPIEQTKYWLAWLARRMVQHGQTDFYFERMQPDWLEGPKTSHVAYQTAVRIATGLFSGVFSGLFFSVFSELLLWAFSILFHSIAFHLLSGLIGELLSGLIVGLAIGLTQRIEPEIKPAEVVRWSWKSMWQTLAHMKSLRSGLIGALLLGLIVRSVFGLFHDTLDIGILFGPPFGLLLGFFVGLVGKAISQRLDDPQGGLTSSFFPAQKKKYSVRNSILAGFVGAVVIGLLSELFFGLLLGFAGHLLAGLFIGLLVGLPSMLVTGLIITLTHRVRKDVRPVEIISLLRSHIWGELVRSESLRNTLIITLGTGLVAGLVGTYLIKGMNGLTNGLIIGLANGTMSGLVFECISGIIGGLSSDQLERQILTRPNQGMRRSARNSLLVGFGGGLLFGLIVGLLIGLFVGLILGLFVRPSAGLIIGPIVGLFSALVGGTISGLSIGLSNGGSATIQHVVLRLFLWRTGSTPWHYERFLDNAAERILLRKVGGGYMFIHRLLLDYFATFDPSPPSGGMSFRQKVNEQEKNG